MARWVPAALLVSVVRQTLVQTRLKAPHLPQRTALQTTRVTAGIGILMAWHAAA
jgi:hypothetical protein